MATTDGSSLILTDEFRAALTHLNGGSHLFLTGRAGTGKSTLVRHYMQTTHRKTLVVAPTGIAALNVDGYTIHRLFGFRPGTTPEQVRSRSYRPGRYAGILSTVDTLVVDEASMVRADLFDNLAAALERFGPRPGTPFGGVQIVLVGDLYQLPPVVTPGEEEYFTTVYESPFFFSATSYSTDTFPVVELTQVFRQRGDDQLVRLLNAVRDGSLDDATMAELNQQVRQDFIPPHHERWLTLTTTNRIAGARNNTMLDTIDAPLHTSEAVTTGDLDGYEPTAERSIHYKHGAQVMMLTNDPGERWVNGTIAHIIHIDDDGAVTVTLPDGSSAEVRHHTWEITRPTVSGGRLTHETIGTFTQLPFKLAWAITIHKSQGQTLDRCVVDLSGGTFADGQLYVGLSRSTSLKWLVLARGVEPKDLKVNQRIRRYLHSGGRATRAAGTAYIGICPVGESGRMSRPRPVELAVITDSGDEISTLINPQRDMGEARAAYGITAADILLAPRLPEAWNALAPFLAGRTPVGHDIDRVLGEIDFELKRSGVLAAVPVGNDLTGLTQDDLTALTAPTAIQRARAARAIDRRRPARTSSDVFPDAADAVGYLHPRDTTTFLVAGATEQHPDQVLADLLTARAATAIHDAETLAVLHGVQQLAGRQLTESAEQGSDTIDAVLVAPAGICFTGSARDLDGKPLSRGALEDMARERGLTPVPSVTKTKCHALVTAEAASQSGKAKQARGWGKPIYTVDEFLRWHRGLPPRGAAAPGTAHITIDTVPVPVPAQVPVSSSPAAQRRPEPRPQEHPGRRSTDPQDSGLAAPVAVQAVRAAGAATGRLRGLFGRRGAQDQDRKAR